MESLHLVDRRLPTGGKWEAYTGDIVEALRGLTSLSSTKSDGGYLLTDHGDECSTTTAVRRQTNFSMMVNIFDGRVTIGSNPTVN